MTPTFTCPVCFAMSHHPEDVAQGFCSRCQAWSPVPEPAHDLDWARWMIAIWEGRAVASRDFRRANNQAARWQQALLSDEPEKAANP